MFFISLFVFFFKYLFIYLFIYLSLLLFFGLSLVTIVFIFLYFHFLCPATEEERLYIYCQRACVLPLSLPGASLLFCATSSTSFCSPFFFLPLVFPFFSTPTTIFSPTFPFVVSLPHRCRMYIFSRRWPPLRPVNGIARVPPHFPAHVGFAIFKVMFLAAARNEWLCQNSLLLSHL